LYGRDASCPYLVAKTDAHTDDPSGGRRWARLAGAALVTAAVLGAAVLGWRWHRNIPVRQVVVDGAARAAPDSLKALTRVDTGQALYRLRPRRVADRAERHPWVRKAGVSRHADGTLRIAVTERTPAALVWQDGEAAYYLDAAGYPLPVAPDSSAAAFDVPLVRGLAESFQPLSPTEHDALRRLLTALEKQADARALVSEIRTTADSDDSSQALQLRTVLPAGRARSAEVHLGTGAFPEKLRRLVAFWRQAVKEQPQTAFHEIDLRFDGQIVARQDSLAPASPLDS
jgi:cell division protein FtsQ